MNYKRIKDIIRNIIFGTETPAGKAFDIVLILIIVANSIVIIAESVDIIRFSYGTLLTILGWFFVIIFTIEYILRLLVVKKRFTYLFSFFGIIDLLAIIPTYLAFVLPQMRFLVVIRVFRLLRLFSILKMGRYIDESSQLLRALKASKAKISVFLFTILFIVIIVGSMMYIIEGPENGFDNIPESMYWAIVTISTVGYGDISPQTPLGKILSSLLMIIAYGIIAVPTGIITSELAHTSKNPLPTKFCNKCNSKYSGDNHFCSKCGASLN
ncbi:ion transporter [Alkalibaculum sp. M08DMB]|uniref:Ion transporter n=1 Tax=Alkalibaculum sporogenes TaxID=2655001 RepID=A0A6A7K5P8_9FIRM|nr:ion transporter [Alkalibaculum sporogenes]MPW24674.1 ion transporter [Alkalibaculum sporogenes]